MINNHQYLPASVLREMFYLGDRWRTDIYNFAVDGMLLGDRSYLGENFYIVDLTSVYYSVDSRTRISHTQTSNRTQAR